MVPSESQELISKALAGAGSEHIIMLADLLDILPLALSQAAAFNQENGLEVEEYLELYAEGDAALVELLSQPSESQGRDSGVPNAVPATWMISFDYILKAHSAGCRHDFCDGLLLPNSKRRAGLDFLLRLSSALTRIKIIHSRSIVPVVLKDAELQLAQSRHTL